MKHSKFIFSLAILTIIFSIFTAHAEQYPKTFIVDSINYDTDTITFIDANDEEWIWYGTEDWAINDMAAAIVDDNETIYIHDDVIVKIYYQMNIKEWIEPNEV